MITTVQKAADGNIPLSHLQTVNPQEKGIFGHIQGFELQATNKMSKGYYQHCRSR